MRTSPDRGVRPLRRRDPQSRADVAFAVAPRIVAGFVFGVALVGGVGGWAATTDLSGAILASIVQRAKERAIERTLRSADGGVGGLTEEDVLTAVRAEFREGEVLPPDDSAEEWLKLLDHHPEQVVGISSYRRGRPSEERLVNQII